MSVLIVLTFPQHLIADAVAIIGTMVSSPSVLRGIRNLIGFYTGSCVWVRACYFPDGCTLINPLLETAR